MADFGVGHLHLGLGTERVPEKQHRVSLRRKFNCITVAFDRTQHVIYEVVVVMILFQHFLSY